MSGYSHTRVWPRCLLVALISFATSSVIAQSWPAKPVRLVVAWAAGGATDTMARVFTPYYSRAWGQPVIVENRPGAGGHVGAELVSRSAPDGLTLLMTASGQAAGPALYKKLGYDPVNDLAPVTPLVISPTILVVNPKVPAGSLKDLIALAKAQPGKLNYGSTGAGSGPNLSFEMFKSMAGIDIVHVPYKGDGPLFPALIANDVQAAMVPPQTGLPHINTGRLRALAVGGSTRLSALPDVPTIAEAGVSGYEYVAWVAIFAPKGTPREIVNKINADSARILAEPEIVIKYLPAWGVNAMSMPADAFAARYLADIEKNKKIVREAKIPQID